MAICPKCGSTNVISQIIEQGSKSKSKTKTKHCGNGALGKVHNIGRIIAAPFTLGGSLFMSKKAKGDSISETKTTTKTKLKQVFICQNCGNQFDKDTVTDPQLETQDESKSLAEKTDDVLEGAGKVVNWAKQQHGDVSTGSIVAIVLCSIFVPPVGIFLIIRSKIVKKKPIAIGVAVWTVLWCVGLVMTITNPQIKPWQSDSSSVQTESDKTKKEIACDKDNRERLLGYGDENVFNLLQDMGIEQIYSVGARDNDFDLTHQAYVLIKGDRYADKLFITYDINNKISSIKNAEYDITYYSVYEEAEVVEYPGVEKINLIKEKEKTQKAEEEAYRKNHIVESDYDTVISSIKNDIIKSVLVSPKTAKFPDGWLDNYGWDIANDGDYATFSSYVDSQNVYGATIRNTFSLTYCKRDGYLKVVRFVFDNVLMSEDYSKCQ